MPLSPVSLTASYHWWNSLPLFGEIPIHIFLRSASPRKEFWPQIPVSFAAKTQQDSGMGRGLSQSDIYKMNFWFRGEQGEGTGSLGSLVVAWCRRLQKCVAFEGGGHSPVVTAVSAGVGWGGSNNPSHGSFLIRPVLQHGSELHSRKLSLEPLLQSFPEFPELTSIILICSFPP